MSNCNKCGSPMLLSKANKMYCSSKCWLDEEEQVKPNNTGMQVDAPVVKPEYSKENYQNPPPKNEKFRTPLQIVREGCLNAAVEHTKNGEPMIKGRILKLAEDFETWILR